MAAAMSVIAYPELVKRGYPKWMAAGVIASAGGIALLIPPSITLILFGVITEMSIVDLFLRRNNTWLNVSYRVTPL